MQELPLEQVLGQEERTLEQQRKRAKEAKMLSKDQEKRYAHLLTTLSEYLKLLQEQGQASEEEKFGASEVCFPRERGDKKKRCGRNREDAQQCPSLLRRSLWRGAGVAALLIGA